MQNKIVKKGIGSDVFPSGSFITNLALELARRMIRNGEKINFLIEEVRERFKDIKDSDIYALLSELQKLGFDVTPNEWIYLTPVEYRTAMLKKLNIVKNAKVYGSRFEDIMEAIKDTKEELKVCTDWLKDNADARRLNPQTYYIYYDKKLTLEKKLEDLKKALQLSKAAKLYDRTYAGGVLPLKPLSLVVDDKVSFILLDNQNQLIKSAAENLESKSSIDQEKESEEFPIPLSRLFEKLGTMKALKPFWGDFKNNYGEIYDDPERISEAINDLLDYIDRTKDEKNLTSKQVNEAYKIIEDFINQQAEKGIQLDTKIKEYVDHSMDTEEDDEPIESISEFSKSNIEELAGSEIGGNPPETKGELAVTTSSNKRVILGNMDSDIAKALQYLNKINDLLLDIRTGSSIPKTVHVDKAIDSLQSSLRDIKNYIERELPYNSEIERKAARTVLSNIMKKLSVLIDLYTDKSGMDEVMKYISSSDFLKTIKISKLLLDTLGE